MKITCKWPSMPILLQGVPELMIPTIVPVANIGSKTCMNLYLQISESKSRLCDGINLHEARRYMHMSVEAMH